MDPIEPQRDVARARRQPPVVAWWVVALAFGLLVLHNLDEAFVHPESGGRLNVVGNTVLGIIVVVLFVRIPRWWRVGLTGLLGLLATVQAIGGHVSHVLSGDAVPLDYSGLAYLAGGLLLVGVAVAEARGPAAGRRTSDA